MTISAKLRTAFLLSLAIAVVAFVFIMLFIRNTRIEQNVSRTGFFLHHITERDKEELANEIFEGRFDAIRIRINKIAEIPDIYAVMVFDVNESIIVSSTGFEAQNSMDVEVEIPESGYVLQRIFANDPATLKFTKGISAIGERLGYIQIYYSLDVLMREIILEFIVLTALILSIPVSIFVFLFMFFRVSIMKPIEALRNSMSRVIEEGPGITTDIDKNDEIGDLARSFNTMSGKLKTSYTEITRQGEELKKTLGEREILIHDIHHRVKNNLAVIQSLMSLEQSKIDEEKRGAVHKYREAFNKLSVRIFVISSIYNHLYQTNAPVDNVNCEVFFNTLIRKLADLHNSDHFGVSFEISIEPLTLPLNIVIPLALVINEVISNSYKHAFGPEDRGTITLEIKQDDGDVLVKVSDDGSGFPPDFEEKKDQSLGIQLIDLLSSQIKAETTVSGDQGVSYAFRLKEFYGKDSGRR